MKNGPNLSRDVTIINFSLVVIQIIEISDLIIFFCSFYVQFMAPLCHHLTTESKKYVLISAETKEPAQQQ